LEKINRKRKLKRERCAGIKIDFVFIFIFYFFYISVDFMFFTTVLCVAFEWYLKHLFTSFDGATVGSPVLEREVVLGVLS
jgi:hypothetical protein